MFQQMIMSLPMTLLCKFTICSSLNKSIQSGIHSSSFVRAMTTSTIRSSTTKSCNRQQQHRRRLWIDTDVGFDDLVAIQSLQAHGSSIDLITTVCGMNSASQGACGLKRLMPDLMAVVAASRDRIDDVMGEAQRKQHDWIPDFRNRFQDFVNQHQHQRLDDVKEYDSNCHVESTRKLLLDSEDSSVDLICLGPLSNLADFLNEYPSLLSSKLSSVWILGGSHPDRGIEEFNFGQDPIAAQKALSSPYLRGKIYIVPGEQTSYKCVPSSYTQSIVQVAAENVRQTTCTNGMILSSTIVADPNFAIFFDPICCFLYHQTTRHRTTPPDALVLDAPAGQGAAGFEWHRISVCPFSGKTLTGEHGHWIVSSVDFDQDDNSRRDHNDATTATGTAAVTTSYKEWILSAIKKSSSHHTALLEAQTATNTK
jgi:inosine-uridine nucleoside N-ribohydrolase